MAEVLVMCHLRLRASPLEVIKSMEEGHRHFNYAICHLINDSLRSSLEVIGLQGGLKTRLDSV